MPLSLRVGDCYKPAMARALSIELTDAWCHVTARGKERRAIFRAALLRQAQRELHNN